MNWVKMLAAVVIALAWTKASAQEVDPGMAPSESQCLEEAALSLQAYIARDLDSSEYVIKRNGRNLPTLIQHQESSAGFGLDGIWQEGPNEEFIQFSGEMMIYNAVLKQTTKTPFCQLVLIQGARKY